MLDDEEFQSIMYKDEGDSSRAHVQRVARWVRARNGLSRNQPKCNLSSQTLSLWHCLLQERETFAHAQCESMRIVHAKTELKKEGRAKTRPAQTVTV